MPDPSLWSSDEDLDLKRYELKVLQQHKDAGSLSDVELAEVYKLRCEMIDGLTERIETRAELEQMQLGFGVLGGTMPQPEPELEFDSMEKTGQLKTPRGGLSVSFSLGVDVDESPVVRAGQQVSDGDATALGSPGADAGAPDSSIGADDQLPDLEAVLHPLNAGHKLPSGLVMLPSSPSGDAYLASPSPSFEHASTDADAETSLDRAPGIVNIGEAINMSVVGSMMLSPKLHESELLEDGVVGQRLLSSHLRLLSRRLRPGACC